MKMTEQSVLRVSIGVTILVAAVGIIFGIILGSSALIFDGVYSLTDASMTIVALLVSKLIASSTSSSSEKSRLDQHFTMGFWHLEPMVLGLNGVMLTGAAIYALINAVSSILAGGRHLDFGYATIYAAFILLAASSMAVYGYRANKNIRSDFLALDAKAWTMGAALTAALLGAFIVGFLVQGTQLQWISPYVDPVALAIICLIIIPLPATTIKQALADILLVTPKELKLHVDQIASEIVQQYDFLDYRSYVAKVGRGRQIELYFIVPKKWPAQKLEEWDRIRDEIGEAIGNGGPNRWLTIAFTTDPERAE